MRTGAVVVLLGVVLSACSSPHEGSDSYATGRERVVALVNEAGGALPTAAGFRPVGLSDTDREVEFYTSVFKNSKILSTEYYPKSAEEGLADFQKDLAGKVLTIEFELNGLNFAAINAGPEFKFNESVSFAVECKEQEEIDYYWEKLSSVPESVQCGWCKDKYGLSWQIVPSNMADLMSKPDAYKTLMKQKKIIISEY